MTPVTPPPHTIVAACPLTSSLWGCHSSWDFLRYSLSLSAGISGVIRWSGPCHLIHTNSEQRYTLQLDVIPTVGFSDPILSYFSALQFVFDGVRMLKDGYQKVICLSLLYAFFVSMINPVTLLSLDKTRSIQNCNFSEMDGADCRIWVYWRCQEGPRRCLIYEGTNDRSKLTLTEENSYSEGLSSAFKWNTR